MKGKLKKIKDCFDLLKTTEDPRKHAHKLYHHFSLPSFDNGRKPDIVTGSEIDSSKFKVENNVILFNKLNVRFKRVWNIHLLQSENSICSTEFLQLKPKNDFQDFLYYSLINNDFTNKLKNCASGTSGSHQRISPDLFLEETIFVPSIDVQKSIADVLSSLDSKIELNNRINAELEAMAKKLYDYWFVQFDFPDKNGKPYKSSGGKMVWNEELKREIPEGWEVKLLSDWIEKDKSGDWGKESEEGNYTERVHCIRGADINGLNGKGEVKAPVRYILPKNSHKILEPFDLIIEISGGSPTQSTGRLAFLIEETISRFDAPVICSNFCKAVTLKYQKSLFNFVFEWNNAYDNGVLFGFEGKTSGIKNLLFESFVTSYKTAVPPLKLMEDFFQNVYFLELKKQKLLKENNELAALRDWLLPMLMNGQVKVN